MELKFTLFCSSDVSPLFHFQFLAKCMDFSIVHVDEISYRPITRVNS